MKPYLVGVHNLNKLFQEAYDRKHKDSDENFKPYKRKSRKSKREATMDVENLKNESVRGS